MPGKKPALMGLFVLMFLPSVVLACPQGWTNCVCSDSETLLLYENIPTSTGTYISNTTIDCRPYACNNITRTCANPYNISAIQSDFGLPLFILLTVIAFGSLIIGFKGKKILFCIMATILFAVLALQSFALETIFVNTMFYGFVSIFIGIFWLLTIVSFLATLLGAVKSTNNKDEGASC